jgi:hypothetical protein
VVPLLGAVFLTVFWASVYLVWIGPARLLPVLRRLRPFRRPAPEGREP